MANVELLEQAAVRNSPEYRELLRQHAEAVEAAATLLAAFKRLDADHGPGAPSDEMCEVWDHYQCQQRIAADCDAEMKQMRGGA
jgi:hypothetical protein